MVEGLPIGPDGILRAAEITKHGPEALAEAKKQTKALKYEGFESAAKTWDLVCTVIWKLDGGIDAPVAPLVGETMRIILINQFQRLRDGDRS